MIQFSIIIPIYNRPDELDELLGSLIEQEPIFEVIVVEDGSSNRSDGVVDKYSNSLTIKYIYQSNTGPAMARNRGVEEAVGEWLIILDSDTMLPAEYILNAQRGVEGGDIDFFGGADCEHPSFTAMQKAINYSMTSPLSSGGIRGSKKSMDKFYPRSFNMGVRRDIFNSVGGFSNMRFGEDIDLSYRIIAAGGRSAFLPDVWLYHKRRANLRQFFKQLYNSGIARIVLSLNHPGSLKLVHTLPAVFLLGVLFLILSAPICPWSLLPILLLAVVIFIDALLRCSNLKVAMLAVATTITQLVSYGAGFISGVWNVLILKRKKYRAFSRTFYD
ncbi:MAG: glycosyltransferase [Rikenellaceae bacterium]